MNARSSCPPRLAPMLGASAMLLLSVAMSLSVEQIAPVVREFQRETATERAAVRELAVSLAKAVRQLSGTGSADHSPGILPQRDWPPVVLTTSLLADPPAIPARAHRPRVALLNLPPPSIA